VVLPEAELKIYLDASVEERAMRRYEELKARGEDRKLVEVEAAMRKRDDIDANRTVAPLIPAKDAVIIRSDGKLPEDVLEQVFTLVMEKQSEFN
jgi:cytidylate kinase